MSVLQLIVFVCVYLCIMYMSVHQQSLTHVHAIMPAAMKTFVALILDVCPERLAGVENAHCPKSCPCTVSVVFGTSLVACRRSLGVILLLHVVNTPVDHGRYVGPTRLALSKMCEFLNNSVRGDWFVGMEKCRTQQMAVCGSCHDVVYTNVLTAS
jgi:hypothetical protein